MQSVPLFHAQGGNVELFCYCLCPNDGSPYRQKIEREAEHFVDISGIKDAYQAARNHALSLVFARFAAFNHPHPPDGCPT